MPRSPELITLISDDEDSPLIDEVTLIVLDKKEPIKLKESARKSIVIRNEIATKKKEGSSIPKPNSSHYSNLLQKVSSVSSNVSSLNHTSSSTSKVSNKKLIQTARKSMYSSLPSEKVLSNNNSNVVEKPMHSTKTILLNEKKLQELKSRDSQKSYAHNHIVAESKSGLSINKSQINTFATHSFDKLKERGVSIRPSEGVSSTKGSHSNTQVNKNSSNNVNEKIHKNMTSVTNLESKLNSIKQLNGVSKNSSENIKTQNNQKSMLSSPKFDKDVSLSWSKKRKLTDDPKLRSESKDEPSAIRKVTAIESKAGNQSLFASRNSESRLNNQSKNKTVSNNSNATLPSKLIKDAGVKELPCKTPEVFAVSPNGTTHRSNSVSLKSLSDSTTPLKTSSMASTGKKLDFPEVIDVSPDITALESGSILKNSSKSDIQLRTGITSTETDLTSRTFDVVNMAPNRTAFESGLTLENSSKPAVQSKMSLSSTDKTILLSGDSSATRKMLNTQNVDVDGALISLKDSVRGEGSGVTNLLNSEPMPSFQKVQQYLDGNAADQDISSEFKKQATQVTSPKLSLKRKRQDSDLPSKTAKKSLFSSEFNASTLQDEESHAAQTKTEELESVDGQGSLGKEALPGPSHETSSVESNKEKFDMLIEFCMRSEAWNQEEKLKLKKNLLKHFNYASEQFTSSLSFSNLIDTTMASIGEFPRRSSTFLYDLKEKLMAHRQRTCRVKTEKTLESDSHKNNCSGDDNSVASKSLLAALNLHPTPVVKPHESSTSSSGKNTERRIEIDHLASLKVPHKAKLSHEEAKRKLDEKIKKLEKHLEELHKKIKKLQAKELSLDDLDDEDSTYILEDKYKRKITAIYKMLCKLNQSSSRLDFEIERRFRFNGTRYLELNQAVERFMNKRKGEKFPNYVDIINLVKNANESLMLGIRESEYSILAREIFEDVGNELKKRRRVDEEHNFGCYLTDVVNLEDDPAEKDEELKKKLDDSVMQGEQKLKEIIEKYAAQQESTKSGEEETVAEEEEESDASLEPQFEDDDDLPSTNPATPVAGVPEEVHRREIPLLIVGSDSDASTDPGLHIANDFPSFNLEETKASYNSTLSITPSAIQDESSNELPFL